MTVFIHLSSTWTVCDHRVFIESEFACVPRKDEYVLLSSEDIDELQRILDELSDEAWGSFEKWRQGARQASFVSNVSYARIGGAYLPCIEVDF